MSRAGAVRMGTGTKQGDISRDRGINPVAPRDNFVYWVLGAILIMQIAVSLSLYACIRAVEREVHEVTLVQLREPHITRYKRRASPGPEPEPVGSAVAPGPGPHEFMEDNAVPSSYGTTSVPYEDEKGSWIMSLSRIPVDTVQSFCKQYCPAGPPGTKGTIGNPGARGVEGPRGERGDRGYPGEPGTRGPKGDKGSKGQPGLDGRDGIPGEPGLDGVPGRNGIDGTAGTDGKPGRDGIPGIHGTNGTNGRPGSPGPPGPAGPPGLRGMSGPRGKMGIPGQHGTPGEPGVNTYKVMLANGTFSSQLLIPPSIPGSGRLAPQRPILVEEGRNVRLRCAATGHPLPMVVWKKLPKGVIPLGSWDVNYESGHTLNITRISRLHMGDYICIADNGIPPSANQTFRLEVHFPPLITIRQQMVGVANESTARLECEVEANPDPVLYWEGPEGRQLEPSDKHHINSSVMFESEGYKTVMQLNITRVGPGDVGHYKCYAKNALGLMGGDFTVHLIDPRLSTPPPLQSSRPVTFGKQPPELATVDDLCPPQPQCPTCPTLKDGKNVTELRCRESRHEWRHDLEVYAFANKTFPGYRIRSLNCKLYVVGKAVYLANINVTNSWMRDSVPNSEASGEQFWATRINENYTLYEYSNKTTFRSRTPHRKIKLPYPFVGNSHVVYNGSFFYADIDYRLVRFDLQSETYKVVTVPEAGGRLYSGGHNILDISVDDNGLWVIYGLNNSNNNNTIVMKVDAFGADMQPQYMWNISMNHFKVGEMFIVCGVLYAVDSATDDKSSITFALDLYRNTLFAEVDLVFTNPFQQTTMLGYSHRHKELYSVDRGNQLTYPVRYHEIFDDKSTKEDKEEPEVSAVRTGFDVS